MLRAVFMLAAILALPSLVDLGSMQQGYPKEIKVCDKKDRLGPVDNRLSTDYLHHFDPPIFKKLIVCIIFTPKKVHTILI